MTKFANRIGLGLILAGAVLIGLCGCNQRAQSPQAEKFFVDWLAAHGESNIVADAHGVGIAGSPTRLRCSLYQSARSTNGIASAELEFRVLLPDGREMVDFVAGDGKSIEQAENDAKINFVVSTFHVIYRSFLNPNDPHQTAEKITVAGQPRELVMGDTMTRSQTTNGAPDLFPFREQFRQIVASQPLSPQTHWIKIIYANHQSKMMLCAVTLDNEDSPVMTEAVKNLPWPKQDQFYMLKQFLVVK